jgi:hypothetical protein
MSLQPLVSFLISRLFHLWLNRFSAVGPPPPPGGQGGCVWQRRRGSLNTACGPWHMAEVSSSCSASLARVRGRWWGRSSECGGGIADLKSNPAVPWSWAQAAMGHVAEASLDSSASQACGRGRRWGSKGRRLCASIIWRRLGVGGVHRLERESGVHGSRWDWGRLFLHMGSTCHWV